MIGLDSGFEHRAICVGKRSVLESDYDRHWRLGTDECDQAHALATKELEATPLG